MAGRMVRKRARGRRYELDGAHDSRSAWAMIGNRGRAPRGGSFTRYVALLNSLRHGAEAVVFNLGSLSLSLSLPCARAYFRKRHHPRPPATTAASARRSPRRDGGTRPVVPLRLFD